MDTTLLNKKFERIGARVKFNPVSFGRVRLDIRKDRHGEHFVVNRSRNLKTDLEVLDVQPRDRHLLLMVREESAKHKFLCGHDERHWFVAAIPEKASVGTVLQAKESLKPLDVLRAQSKQGLRSQVRNRRKNAAFRRQGEWFFLPSLHVVVDPKTVLRDEPIRRGRGKAHWAEYCYRTGGEIVYVCNRNPNGLTADQHRKLLVKNPEAKKWNWRAMSRNGSVYVRGRISHPDHATITLHGWHRVMMNTENQSVAMRNVAFLD